MFERDRLLRFGAPQVTVAPALTAPLELLTHSVPTPAPLTFAWPNSNAGIRNRTITKAHFQPAANVRMAFVPSDLLGRNETATLAASTVVLARR